MELEDDNLLTEAYNKSLKENNKSSDKITQLNPLLIIYIIKNRK